MNFVMNTLDGGDLHKTSIFTNMVENVTLCVVIDLLPFYWRGKNLTRFGMRKTLLYYFGFKNS